MSYINSSKVQVQFHEELGETSSYSQGVTDLINQASATEQSVSEQPRQSKKSLAYLNNTQETG